MSQQDKDTSAIDVASDLKSLSQHYQAIGRADDAQVVLDLASSLDAEHQIAPDDAVLNKVLNTLSFESSSRDVVSE